MFGKHLQGDAWQEESLNTAGLQSLQQQWHVPSPLGLHQLQTTATAERCENLLERNVE